MKRLINVSMFKNARDNKTCGTMNLWDWLLERNRYTTLVETLRLEPDDSRRKRIKDLLPAITPSGVFHRRNANSLMTPSNLICIDIDGKDNPSISDMEELKARLAKLPYVMYCGLSASGTGLFCIIPYEDYRKHKLHFYALEQDFKDMGIVVDSSCSDICRLRFYSYDEHPHINTNAEVYTKTLEKPSVIRSRPHHKTSSGVLENPGNEATENSSLEEILLQSSNLDSVSVIPQTKTQQVEKLLKLVVEKQIDITQIYNDWIKIGLVIKNLFGDKGLDLFLKVSSFYPNYSQEEAENKYLELDEKRYRANTQNLFDIAAKYGIYK